MTGRWEYDSLSIMGYIFEALKEIQLFTQLSLRSIWNVFQKPRYIRDTFLQMDSIGLGSIMIVSLTGLFTGAVLALQSSKTLKSFGAVNLTGQLVALSLVRELGPVLTALMIAGRVGSGIAAELGSMAATEQINAMRALGTDPTKKLVTPRLLATLVMLPLLTLVCNFLGLVGGWLVSLYKLRISSSLFWLSSFNALSYTDLVQSMVKPLFFAFLIAMIGSHYGLRTTGGTQGVGRSTNQAMVLSSILVIVADFFLNTIIIELSR